MMQRKQYGRGFVFLLITITCFLKKNGFKKQKT